MKMEMFSFYFLRPRFDQINRYAMKMEMFSFYFLGLDLIRSIVRVRERVREKHCPFHSDHFHPTPQYRCIKAGTERVKNSFYLKAIRLLNSHH